MSSASDDGHGVGLKSRRSATVARVAQVTRVQRVARATRRIRRPHPRVWTRAAGRLRRPPGTPATTASQNTGLTLRQAAPAFVTLIALAFGLGALEAARLGSWDMALRLVLLAAVADGLDGTLARKLGAVSPMGKQLDSLSDVIAFGVAPAFLFTTYHGDAPDAARYGVALLFVSAGAYRLARFHAQPKQDVFDGLPITIAGAMLAIAVAGPFSFGATGTGLIGVALALLMVSRQPFPAYSRWRWTLLPAVLVAVVVVAVWPRIETVSMLAAVVLGLYVLASLAGSAAMAGRPLLNLRKARNHGGH